MNISTIAFLITGFACIILSFILDGGHVSGLLSLTAALIVFGGTIGAVGVSFPTEDIKRLPKILNIIFKSRKTDMVETVKFFKELSVKTRKNGLLSIESDLSSDDIDDFTKKGLQLVVDGVEPQSIQSILELELDSASERHRQGAAIFESAGGYAPTMGIIGTVMGLVHVLSNLSEPSELGGKIAVAFIATLYGVASANLLWLPMGAKLKAIDNIEYNEKKLVIEAVLLIQVGINPNTLVEKLKGFLTKEQIAKFDVMDKVGEK